MDFTTLGMIMQTIGLFYDAARKREVRQQAQHGPCHARSQTQWHSPIVIRTLQGDEMADRLGRLGLSKEQSEGQSEEQMWRDSAEHSTVAALGDVHDRSSQSSLKMEKLMVALSRTQAGHAADLNRIQAQETKLAAQRQEIEALRARVVALSAE